ncbi:S8 family serine peptidase [Thermosulfurimonas sp. F29]|uniref:S8 family peptidase n=1 Tax=Thermosulfurimonas sp. F29 TaxID=2867247 RepID=UPI001C833150|nr:S8 family serine peptidase [Thermosulfurimonas sp. F29]MBX6424257.1 S8 family serine peptidase [Thermosulfurimonas sp. F29]
MAWLVFWICCRCFGVWAGGWFPASEVLPTQEGDWWLSAIRISEARAFACGRGVTVVMVDSGVKPDHPALEGHLRLDLAYDFGDNDTDVTDRLGHGTATAGLVLQVAPCAEIVPLKINRDGESFFETAALERALAYIFDLLERIDGPVVVNLSLVLSEASGEVTRLVKDLLRKGVPVVAAAGNEGLEELDFPASVPGVISVAAFGPTGELVPSSNRGRGLFLAAPGQSLRVPSIFGEYTYMSGTSLAAAIVSGTLALLMEKVPSGEALFPELWRYLLAEGSGDPDPPGYDTDYGFGRLSVWGALLAWFSRDLPLLPSEVFLRSGEKRTVFFLPDPSLEVLVTDPRRVAVEEFSPSEGRLILRGLSPGEAEIYLYRLSPLKVGSVRVRVQEGQEDGPGVSEALVYPAPGHPEFFCAYVFSPQTSSLSLYLRQTVLSETGVSFRTLWSFSGPLGASPLLYCASLEGDSLERGLQEILLCGPDLSCRRHLFLNRSSVFNHTYP